MSCPGELLARHEDFSLVCSAWGCTEQPCAGSAPVEMGTCQGSSRAWMPVPPTWEDQLLRPESQAGGSGR